MKLFKKQASVPQSYRPVLEASEVLELFARMTLHQQAALMRLMSRNLMIEIDACGASERGIFAVPAPVFF